MPNFTFIGQKCGNTAPKSVNILNFGHKFTPQGRLVCNIFYEILSVCTRLLAFKFLVWSLSGDKQPRSGTYPEIWIRRKGRGVVSSPPSPLFPFPLPSLPLEVGPLIPLRGLGERCKLPQRGLGQSPSQTRIWCIIALNMRSGGNNFNYFPENQLTKFSAV